MNRIASRTLTAAAVLALAACSQDNAPSEAIRQAADSVVHEVDGSRPAKLAEGKYAPRDECRDTPGASDFRAQLAAAIEARDADRLVALAAPDVKLDFGGGAGTDELRRRLGSDPGLWSALRTLTTLGCAVNDEGGITLPWFAAQAMGEADPANAMLVTGERVPLRVAADGAPPKTVSWDIVKLVGGLNPAAAAQKVETSDGSIGFIATDKLRSPLDYRLIASSRDGKWSFTSFVRGD